jgi:D-alanyl-D-alanine carboxypeptidase (penicillin-binding protein 5/6)
MPSSPRRLAGVRALGSSVTAAALISLGLFAAPSAASADPISSSGDIIGGPLLGGSQLSVDHAAGVPPLPATTATSFVVADADSGDVLAALHAHEKLAPASTLKTLTAITLIPRLDPGRPTMAQSDAPSTDGTKAGIVAGTVYKVSDLFTAMLMMSANDAAVALADANGGLAPTLDEMNAEAAHLQARDTVARTPNGLDAPGQSSSAYDLALIFRAGLADPQFRHYLSLKRAAFPAPGGASFQIQTHDKLLDGYPGMVGGKNGYTVAAQASYVGAATRNGHTIIVAVMRDQPNFWDEVKALLDWGFAADGIASPVGELVGPAKPPASSASSGPPAPTQPAAPGGAGGAAGPPASLAATGSTDRGSGAGSGLPVGGILMWTAVGVGGLVFLAACGQLALRRRRRYDSDERYLAGLSRLSALGEVSDRP